jgi:hypothetical protein
MSEAEVAIEWAAFVKHCDADEYAFVDYMRRKHKERANK